MEQPSFENICYDCQVAVYNFLNELDLWLLSMTCKKFLELKPDYGLELSAKIIYHLQWRHGRLVNIAAMDGHLKIMKILLGSRIPDPDVISDAASHGQLEMVKYLHSLGCPLKRDSLYAAASSGDLDTLKYMMVHNPGAKDFPAPYRNPIMREMKTSNVSIIRVSRIVARHGYLHMIQWIRNAASHRFEILASIMAGEAAQGGHIHVLEWLLENKYKFYPGVCSSAALGGQLTTLRWLRSKGYELSIITFGMAARKGNIEIMNFLKEVGCPWSEKVCALTALGGHLDALRWLRERGCPWDSRVYRKAKINDSEDEDIQQRHQDIINWARENGCPED